MDFTANNMKKTELNWYVYEFPDDYSNWNTSNIIDIPQYFMKKDNIK